MAIYFFLIIFSSGICSTEKLGYQKYTSILPCNQTRFSWLVEFYDFLQTGSYLAFYNVTKTKLTLLHLAFYNVTKIKLTLLHDKC